jgi:hypothetical protein
MKLPGGATTISGHSGQSLKLCPLPAGAAGEIDKKVKTMNEADPSFSISSSYSVGA